MPVLDVSVVIITRDRRDDLLTTLARLEPALDSGEVREVLVVDNASGDGTAEVVAREHPRVRVLVQPENLGAFGRTVGVEATRSPVVAFADDDSWWEPGALHEAAGHFARHPDLGLLHARLLVEPDGTLDDACADMALGPRHGDLPGPSITGHLGCATVVRREAYLQAGGYSPLLGFGAEEGLLALDLAAHGWAQCYVDTVVAHHAPSPRREDWPARWARYRRNDTLTALLRLPARHATVELTRLLRQAATDPAVRREVPPLARRLPTVVRRRRPVDDDVWTRWRDDRARGRRRRTRPLARLWLVLAGSPAVPHPLRPLLLRRGGVVVGPGTTLRSRLRVQRTGRVSIGAGAFLNHDCYIDARADVHLGQDVLVGDHVRILTSTHEPGTARRRAGPPVGRSVVIEDGVWLGSGATVLPGVRVGRGCVVAAGAVVARDCEPHGLYAGVPAQRKRTLPTDQDAEQGTGQDTHQDTDQDTHQAATDGGPR